MIRKVIVVEMSVNVMREIGEVGRVRQMNLVVDSQSHALRLVCRYLLRCQIKANCSYMKMRNLAVSMRILVVESRMIM